MSTLTRVQLCACLLVGLLPAGCGDPNAPDAPTFGLASRSIVGGMTDSDDPAVVMLVRGGGAGLCSGTVVDSTHVMFAAHCQMDLGRSASGISVYTRMSDSAMALSAVAFNPQFRQADGKNDVAIATLAQPTSIPPKPLPTGPLPSSAMGQTARIVGFGASSQSGGGCQGCFTKRQGMAQIQMVDTPGGRINAGGPQFVCSGDSGGPLLYPPGPEEAVVGITSGNETDRCTDPSWFTDVGANLSWIMQQGVVPVPPPGGGGEIGMDGGAGASGTGGSAGSNPSGNPGSAGTSGTTYGGGSSSGGGCEVGASAAGLDCGLLGLLLVGLLETRRRAARR